NWTARNMDYELNGHESVFFLVGNQIAGSITPHDSAVVRSDGGTSVGCNALGLRNQLPKGAVVVLFSHSVVGPPRGSWYVNDAVGDSLTSLLDTLRTAWEPGGGVSSRHVWFAKWGVSWLISAHCNGKPSKAERQLVEDLLRSTTFSSLPVVYR